MSVSRHGSADPLPLLLLGLSDELLPGGEIALPIGRRVGPDIGEELHPDIARSATLAAIWPALADARDVDHRAALKLANRKPEPRQGDVLTSIKCSVWGSGVRPWRGKNGT